MLGQVTVCSNGGLNFKTSYAIRLLVNKIMASYKTFFSCYIKDDKKFWPWCRGDQWSQIGPDRPKSKRTETELVQNLRLRTGPNVFGPIRVGPVHSLNRSGPRKHNSRVLSKTVLDRNKEKIQTKTGTLVLRFSRSRSILSRSSRSRSVLGLRCSTLVWCTYNTMLWV